MIRPEAKTGPALLPGLILALVLAAGTGDLAAAKPAKAYRILALTIWKKLRQLDWEGLYGKKFCVVIKDLELALSFSVTENGLRADKTGKPDVLFTATLMDFIRLALRLEDPDSLFFNRRLLIEGNTDIGLRVKNMLDGIEFESLLDSFPGMFGRIVMFVRTRLQNTAS